MMYRVIFAARYWRRHLSFVAALGATMGAQAALAQSLPQPATQPVTQSCKAPATEYDAAACAMQFQQTLLDDRLASQPAPGGLEARLNGSPWIAQGWSSTPFVLKPGASPSESDFSAQASLRHWSAFADNLLAQRIEEAKRAVPGGLILPKPAAPAATGFDVWSSLDRRGSETDPNRMLAGNVGADYKITRDTVLGVSVGMREQELAATSTDVDHSVAAYFAFKPTSALTVGLKAEHADSAGAIAGQNLVSSQDVLSARLAGAMSFGAIKFSPELSVAHGSEEGRTAGREIGTEKTSIKIAPRVSRPIPIATGQQLEPFVSYTNKMDLGSAAPATGVAAPAATSSTQSIGGGVTLSRPDTYALSLSTDVERHSEAERAELKSRMQLSIPLR